MRKEEKTTALVRLAAGLSHELNNIFMVIDGNLSLICEQDDLDGSLREMVDESLTAARRGIELSRNLQAYAGRQALQPLAIDLRQIVRGAMVRMQREFADSEIRVRLPDAPCEVRIDPGQAQSALVELCRNAQTAMPSGGTFTIELRRLERQALEMRHNVQLSADIAHLSVTDNGIGMSDEALRAATDPLFTDKTIAGARTGWGLSVVEGFVRQSGGLLTLSQANTGGICADIYLPVVGADARPQ